VRAEAANDQRRVLDRLAMEQKLLVEQQASDDAELAQLREIKLMRKAEVDEYAARLRKLRNDLFN
jgi:hypothetical protein